MKFEKSSKPSKIIFNPVRTFFTSDTSLNKKKAKLLMLIAQDSKVQIDRCDYEKDGWPEVIKNETRDKFVFGLQDDNLKERLTRN